MCKKSIQIDGLHSCLGEESADARFGTYLAYSKEDKKFVLFLFLFLFFVVFFCQKGETRLGFISFSVLFHPVTKSFNTYFKNSY